MLLQAIPGFCVLLRFLLFAGTLRWNPTAGDFCYKRQLFLLVLAPGDAGDDGGQGILHPAPTGAGDYAGRLPSRAVARRDYPGSPRWTQVPRQDMLRGLSHPALSSSAASSLAGMSRDGESLQHRGRKGSGAAMNGACSCDELGYADAGVITRL